ncbi:MAG: 3-hydroxybutyryl-CoA dehydrogenase [Myxococcales bacterium]|nr:3-hydroxybutyryl-CoA dehydrogenase [Myxococcales bacterium]
MDLSHIRTFGVVGAGQMGLGIAQVAAQAGFTVLVSDANLELAQKNLAKLGGSLDKLVEKGKLPADVRAGIGARLRAVAGPADFAEADLVVEAATERFDLKVQLLASVDAAMKPGAILATNTSSISITKLAAATKRPELVAGMHFMNPVPLMKLCEIVRGVQSSDTTVATVTALAQKLGKTTIVSRDAPGFLVNRVLIPLINEACFALQEGVGTAEDLDTGAKLGLNHPMGPLELADLIGLDTCLAIAEVLHQELGDDKYRPATNLRNLVAAGWLGRKTGRGFYDYAKK